MRNILEKRERSLGTKLFLKSSRCNSPKCVMVRRPQRPGVHGKRRRVLSEFGSQLAEKQKIQFSYGLTNRQMKELFAKKKEEILDLLESRLDRVVYVSGLADSQRVSRRLVSHGHITVNKVKVTSAGYKVKKGDVVAIREGSRDLALFKETADKLSRITTPAWLRVDPKNLSVTCVERPHGDDMNFPFRVDMVGEFYSR